MANYQQKPKNPKMIAIKKNQKYLKMTKKANFGDPRRGSFK